MSFLPHRPFLLTTGLRQLVVAVGWIGLCASGAWAETEFVYTVQPGDNPWSITEHYLIDMTYWPRLQQHNNIADARRIPPGSTLRIPTPWLRLRGAQLDLVSVRGKVELFDGGKWSAPSPTPLTLHAGQRVRTSATGSATLTLGQGALIEVRPASEVVVRRLPGPTDRDSQAKIELELISGELDNAVHSLRATGRALEVLTPSATAAVRGTNFVVRVNGALTHTEVHEGRVDVFNGQGNTSLTERLGTVVSEGGAPSPALPLPVAPDLSGTPEVLDRLPCTLCIAPDPTVLAHRIEWVWPTSGVLAQAQVLSSDATVPDAPLPDGEYELRVRALGVKGVQSPVSRRTVRLSRTHQAAPVLIHLGLDAERLKIDWAAQDPELDAVRLQIARDADFRHIVTDRTIHGGTFSMARPLQTGTVHVRLGRYVPDQEPRWSDGQPVTVPEQSNPVQWTPMYWIENMAGAHSVDQGPAQ